MTLNGTVLFSYHDNTFDRLVQVDDVNGAAMGRYYDDPFGRRLWKQAGDETTLFFYSDEGLVAEYDPTGAEIRSYGYRPDSTWTTDPLWLKQDGEYYFYHNDHLGTPQKLVQQNGAVVWNASYTAFGQATVEVETVANNLRFPGQYFDVETALHYNRHRYYDPNVGRYLRRDPIGLAGGVNVFAYAGNNAVKFGDPWGLACCRTLENWLDCLNKCFQFLNADFFSLSVKILRWTGFSEYSEWLADNILSTPLGEVIATHGLTRRFLGLNKLIYRRSFSPWNAPVNVRLPHFNRRLRPRLGLPQLSENYWVPTITYIIYAWKGGTGFGCAIWCHVDPCSYDEVVEGGWKYLIKEGGREFYYFTYSLVNPDIYYSPPVQIPIPPNWWEILASDEI